MSLEGTATPLKGIRRVAARRMVQAWAAPAFTLSVDVDMTSVLAEAKALDGVTVTDLLLKACANALIAAPDLNAHFADEVVTTFSTVNLGLAVATDAGLMVPVIHGVESLSLLEIAEKRKDVVARARTGKLTSADVDGATFTISNLGMLGIDRFSAILNPPSVGILAIGSAKETVTVIDGNITIAPIAAFGLTCDHRAVDGATGANFLARLRAELQQTVSV